jgi:5S rRNA maturation endonuclease (ribonuclease M5)
MSYKYVDYPSHIVHFNVLCSSPRLKESDVMGALMAKKWYFKQVSTDKLFTQKKIGRIIIEEIKSDTNSKEFELRIPVELDYAKIALLIAEIETITLIGSFHSKIKMTSIANLLETQELKLLNRAREIMKNNNSAVSPTNNCNLYLRYLSQNGISGENTGKVYPLKKEAGLYSSEETKLEGQVFIVEGTSDIKAMVSAGYKNIVSINGNRIMEEENVLALNQLVKSKKVCLFLDGDKAGHELSSFLKKNVTSSSSLYHIEGQFGEVQLLNKLQIDSLLQKEKKKVFFN